MDRDNVGKIRLNVLIMGASGCGKSTIAARLASELGSVFVDADDHHSTKNRAKMAQGLPLTDEDRAPWLKTIAQILQTNRTHGQVLACSALKRAYRSVLLEAVPNLEVFFLSVPRDQLFSRLNHRQNHFFDPRLLDSQLTTLEPPGPEQTIDGSLPINKVVKLILDKLHASPEQP
jgi:gluconokinase